MVKCPNCNSKNISRETQINHVESWFCYDCQSYFDTKVSREVLKIKDTGILGEGDRFIDRTNATIEVIDKAIEKSTGEMVYFGRVVDSPITNDEYIATWRRGEIKDIIK